MRNCNSLYYYQWVVFRRFFISLVYIISKEYPYSWIIKIKRINIIVISNYPKEPDLNSPSGLQNSSPERCGPVSHVPLPFELSIPKAPARSADWAQYNCPFSSFAQQWVSVPMFSSNPQRFKAKEIPIWSIWFSNNVTFVSSALTAAIRWYKNFYANGIVLYLFKITLS